MKSQVEVYLGLVRELVLCNPLGASSQKSLSRDLETLVSRTLMEGLGFLTKLLPRLGKALDQALETSKFTPFPGLKTKKGRSTPAFMQEYFNLVFYDDGSLRPDADPNAVKHLRQVLYVLYKLEVPYSRVQENLVIEAFLETEKELEFVRDVDSDAALAAASYITRTVFRDFDPKDIMPRHGPGAVATGEKLEKKWDFSRLYDRIHQFFPYYTYYVVGGGRELLDRLGWYKSLERLSEGCAKVVLVPKDSRGPRLISAEPLEFQWIQQGLGRKLVGHLESFWMTRGQINFTSQEPNREIALNHSDSRLFATLDLKEASDRVSLALVREVFSQTPQLLNALEACRTAATTLPDGRVVTLKKFAPMGSAICFPVEAYVFWVLLVASLSRDLHAQPSKIGTLIYVYGDDIIVPTYLAERCMQILERFALKVNRSKSCIKGSFRESCGMDAFKGVQVTPLRVKTLWNGRRSAAVLSSYTAYLNNFRKAGYEGVAIYIEEKLRKIYGLLPRGTYLSSFPCVEIESALEAELFNEKNFKSRFNADLQRQEFKVYSVSPSKQRTSLDGWSRLLRNQAFPMQTHPDQVVLPRSTKLKRGWAAIY